MKKIQGILIMMVIVIISITPINATNTNNEESESYRYITALHIISWQLDNGGWSKNKPEFYERYWDGVEKRAIEFQANKVVPLATIDNEATVGELEYLINTNRIYSSAYIRKAIIEGLEFLVDMQYDSGGFPQVYPKQTAQHALYENDATYNDDAMVNVMYLFKDIVNKVDGYDWIGNDLTLYNKIKESYELGLEFIVDTQIVIDDKKTIWGGQYDPITKITTDARPFEPKALMTRESASIIEFLESLNSFEPDIINAIKYAKEWFYDNATIGYEYVLHPENGEYIVKKPDVQMWYRFYSLNNGLPIFATSNGVVVSEHSLLSDSLQDSYGWAGNWGKPFYESLVLQKKLANIPRLVQTTFSTSGKSEVTDKLSFVESGVDYIRTPIFTGVDAGDVIKIQLTICDTTSRDANIYIANKGFRKNRSELMVGHGLKEKVFEFTVLEDFEEKDQYIEFYIDSNNLGDQIDIENLVITINDIVCLTY